MARRRGRRRRRGKSRLELLAREDEWRRVKEQHERENALARYVAAGGDTSLLTTSVSLDVLGLSRREDVAKGRRLPELVVATKKAKTTPVLEPAVLPRLRKARGLARASPRGIRRGELALCASPVRTEWPQRSPVSALHSMIWCDSFDYEGRPSSARWEYQVDANDWVHDERHREIQTYTNSIDNARVEGGTLKIVARVEASGGVTSARLRTKYRGDWLYGRIEVRAKLPASRRGLWPAIWLLPTNDAYGAWPSSGEIDVAEHVGWQQDGLVHSAAHSASYNPLVGSQRSSSMLVPDAHETFHTYCLDWNEERLLILIDNDLSLSVENSGKGIAGALLN